MKITNLCCIQNIFDLDLELLKKTCCIINRDLLVEQYADSSRYINDKVVGAWTVV